MLAFGLLATLCLTAELLLARVLSNHGVDGKYIGLNFLIAEGIIGTICLVIASAAGSGIFTCGLDGTLLMLLAGLFGVMAIGLLQYGIAIGIAGIVSSIYNVNVAVFTALCFFFLNQALSTWQVVGIAITLLGAVFLSLSDDQFKCKKPTSTDNR